MAAKIDFKHVRQTADTEAVFAHFGYTLKKDGSKPGQHKCLCPFHDDTKPSLKVNTDKGIYHCFVCDAAGNILDFVMALENCAIRDAAKLVADISGSAYTPGGQGTGRTPAKPKAASVAPAPTPEPETPAVNPPLSFALKLSTPPELLSWLTTRGIDQAAIDTFGLGLASKKSKTIPERLAIPIHNAAGELVAYCGRFVGDEPPEDVPKYILPGGFHKDLEVFNLHRLDPAATKGCIVLVESYLSVIRHHPTLPVASANGRSIALPQVEAIRAAGFTRALVVGDGDEPGRVGARDVAGALSTVMWARIIDPGDGIKPHHLPTADFANLLRSVF